MDPSRDADPAHARYLERRVARFSGYQRSSTYLTMRDGTKIAIDVCLPAGLGSERVPAIMRQTRYFRRFRVQPMLQTLLDELLLDPMNGPMRRLFTSRGYAWVDVDARGSGASFGDRPCPWWLDGEVADGKEIAEWIVQQPWSNGRIGSTGVSYDGTTADFLATTGHPAVRAIAPRFSLFDVFTDVAFPGGLHNAYFTQAWESSNAALDRNAPGDMVARIYMLQAHGMLDPNLARMIDRRWLTAAMARIFTAALGGVAPVDGDNGELLSAALRSHADNYNTHRGALSVTFRDDSPPDSRLPGQTSDLFSPHSYADRMRGVAVLSYGGWYDGGYANAAVKRHRTLSGMGANSRLLIGPWIHGGQLDLDPDAPGRRATFDHSAELLRFFDPHLWPELESLAQPPPVRYFVMGSGIWSSASAWPPPGVRGVSHYFAAGRKLNPVRATAGEDRAEIDLSAGAGKRSRWRTLLCPFLVADGKGRSPGGHLVYESEALEFDLELAGHPVLELTLATEADDAAIIAYLDDVEPRGEARSLSEGELRTVHRTRLIERPDGPPEVEVSYLRRDALDPARGRFVTHAIELLPLAMRIPAGHRLRLSLGGADVDHFTTPPSSGPMIWRIDLAASRLILPVL